MSKIILSASHSNAITSEKYCVIVACRNLHIFYPVFQMWNVALSKVIPSASHSIAIASEEYCVTGAGRNHWEVETWHLVGQTNEPKRLRKYAVVGVYPSEQAQHALAETCPLLAQACSFNLDQWTTCMETTIFKQRNWWGKQMAV